jgi:hypothetical protein
VDLGIHEPVRNCGQRNRVASPSHVDSTSRIHPGWVQGPAVVIPWVKWRGQFQPIGKPPPADTVWVPGPARKRKLVFNILFSAATVPTNGINLVSQPGDVIVGSLPLSNDETVWLQARQAGISSDERKGIASAEREYQGFQVSGDLSKISPWGIWITTSPAGPPLWVQFPLGRHHFRCSRQVGGTPT